MPRFPESLPADPAALERDVLARWDAEDTFGRSLALRENAPHFVFYEGPPTANGKPGIHHVMARTVKDLFCRYKTMKGYRVDRKAGWDTHGLPVEMEVEKELELEGRHQVEAYGVARYNAACRASVLRYKDLWDGLTERMGYWVNLSDPYVTFENRYIESVWHLLGRLHAKGYLYRGYKIQWYSPANGTVLSSHEVSLGYKEVQDPSVYVRFPLRAEPGTSLLAWTTTPWTLPANAALAVGPKVPYVKVRLGTEGGEEHVILAEALAGKVLGGEGEVVARMTGADLVGTRYAPPFPYFAEALEGTPEADAAWRVVPAHYVTVEDGTGIVHTAPAFGADDFATGQKEGLPLLKPVGPDGRFDEAVPPVAGLWFKDADKPLARDLRERGLLFRHETFLHNYPHDWRKGTPLLQYPVESWFVRTTAVKSRMVELNQTINWQPEGIGQGRMGQWLENNVDWAISRMRFWGTPLPIWVSDRDPGRVEVVSSIEALRARCGGAFPAEALHPETGELDLHRPYVDAITWPDGEGGTMRRVPDLLDVWFDSGAMPWAQWHAPFEGEDRFQANFPADFIAEGVDQTRGWFYTLHALAVLLEDSVAYKNVVVNGLVLDANGEKMSKSKGNTVDPFEAIATHGADAVRWTLMASSPPWENVRYADEAVAETRRRLFGTLQNTYRFFATYAELDGYTPGTPTEPSSRSELDRWILSRLHGTAAEADAAFDAYHPTRAARAIEAFVDDLSNWYLRRSRRRFWAKGEVRGTDGVRGTGAGDGLASAPEGLPYPAPSIPAPDTADKRAAYDTLHEGLALVARLMAPLAPFTSEWLHRALSGDEAPEASVHLAPFPEADPALRDEALEGRMALARAVVTATLALRNEAQIGVRQPLPSLLVVTGVGGVSEATLRSVEGIILDEVNVKVLETVGADSGVIVKSARPNFKALGRRLGPQMKAASEAIRVLTTSEVSRYEAEGRFALVLPEGQTLDLGPGDLDVTSEGVEGRLVRQETAGEHTVTVALDTALDEALRAEGLAREFVNRVQNLRKTAGYHVADRIRVDYAASGAVLAALEAHAETIRNETLALALERVPTPSGDASTTAALGGEDVAIAVRRS